MERSYQERMEERAKNDPVPPTVAEAVAKAKAQEGSIERQEREAREQAEAAQRESLQVEEELARLAAEKEAAENARKAEEERKAKRASWEMGARLRFIEAGGTEEQWTAVADGAWADHLKSIAVNGPTIEEERTASFAEMFGWRRI